MPGFSLPDAGRGIDALADIDHADAANSDRIFVLLMAKSGNRDAVHAGGIEDGGARPGPRRWLAVDGQLNLGAPAWNSCCASFREANTGGAAPVL